MIEKMNQLLKEGRINDLYILARYFYREGQPFLSDASYDRIHKLLIERGLLSEFTSRLYEEDPVPLALLYSLGISPIKTSFFTKGKDNPYYEELVSDQSFSIMPVTTYEESWEYFDKMRSQRLILMLKLNGIYTKNRIDNGLKLSLTRGRAEDADPWDITNQMNLVIGDAASKISGSVRVNGEAFVVSDKLEYLSTKYDGHKPEPERRFKTEKSAAISMLRVQIDPSDYQYCKFLMFSADGLGGTTISENLSIGKDLGFDVVPHIIIDVGQIPESLEEFKVWLRSLLDTMLELQGDLPADGVVVDVDDLSYVSDVNNQYVSRNIALKLEHWSHDYYTGIVKNIIEEQRAVTCSYVIEIEPMRTNDRTNARRINAFNPGIIFDEKITKGSRIYFERNSGAVNILLHGNKVPSKKEGSSTTVNSF